MIKQSDLNSKIILKEVDQHGAWLKLGQEISKQPRQSFEKQILKRSINEAVKKNQFAILHIKKLTKYVSKYCLKNFIIGAGEISE